MKQELLLTDRRTFLKTAAIASAGMALLTSAAAQTAPAEEPMPKLKLGFDNFSIRAMKWKAGQLLDYAASLKLDSILISDLDAYESFEESYLKDIGKKARDLGIELHAGTWSICPTSKFFKNKWGTAEEHLALGIRVAKTVGSPVLRVILGMADDRKTPGGIEARMADTVKVCKSQRSVAMDSGIKIAIENHAGDMQAWELVQLIEEAGKEYVGATLDSGNACWTMEDPMQSLEILAPYTLTTGLRDSIVWEYEDGARVLWVATGTGLIKQREYFRRFAQVCPGVPANLEVISGLQRDIPYFKDDYMALFPKAREKDFVKFLAMAKQGKPMSPHHSPDNEAEQVYQRAQLEMSVKYCKETLGLGMKT